MPRRQSIPNGYPHRPGTHILPPSYQPEPIPMITGHGKPYQPIPMAYSNSFKHNRVAPPPADYYTYDQRRPRETMYPPQPYDDVGENGKPVRI